MTVKKAFFAFITCAIFTLILWNIILSGYSGITSFSFWLDDWPLIWGSSQQKSVFYNPAKVSWNFADERFAAREGYIQIWITTLLYQFNGLNPYWYHMFGLLAKLTASLSLTWAGWKISKKIYVGAITGLIFAASALGGESLYWFNVNSAYLVIAISAIALPFLIEGVNGNKKRLIISLILTALGIYLYPPRAHVFLAMPILALLWSKNIFNKKVWINILIFLAVIFMAYKLPAGGSAEKQAYNAVLNRLIVFGGNGLNDGNHMFFTYPIDALSLSIFPEKFLVSLANFPHRQIFTHTIPSHSSFFTWNFLIFPAIWTLLLGLIFMVLKNNNQRTTRKQFFTYLTLGGAVFISNELLRRYFLESRFWDWNTHFLFTLSLICIMFSLASLYFFRKMKTWENLAKILLSSLILVLISYIINWAYDPLIHPGSLNISRYLTLPAAFGSLFFATLLGMAILLCLQIYKKNKKNKTISSILLIKPGSFMIVLILCIAVYKVITVNLELGKTIIENLRPIRSQENVGIIFNTISADIKNGPKPTIILLDTTWDYADIFAILLYTGHSLATWNNIHNPKDFPQIYYDEKKMLSELPNLCAINKLTPENFYRFRVEINKATNISSQFPKISCQNLPPITP